MGATPVAGDAVSLEEPSVPRIGWCTRLLMVLSVLALLGILTAEPARADPARPTNYRSEVTGTEPGLDGVSFQVVGGDAFLEVSVSVGHSVLVPGYFDEPYIRIDRDNTVWVNQGSPAYYINQDRYGETGVPSGIDAESPPMWIAVGSNGHYAWHDHRIHWMSYDRPPTVAGDAEQTIFPWELPLVADEVDTILSGDLVWIPSRSPLPAILAGVIALLPLVVWGLSKGPASVVMLGTAALLAVTIASFHALGTPPSARSLPLEILIPAGGLVASIAHLAFRKSNVRLSTWAGFAAALLLATWGLTTISVLWMPVLPSGLPPVLERGSVAYVIWAALAAGVGAGVDIMALARR